MTTQQLLDKIFGTLEGDFKECFMILALLEKDQPLEPENLSYWSFLFGSLWNEINNQEAVLSFSYPTISLSSLVAGKYWELKGSVEDWFQFSLLVAPSD